jgi:sialate O-acetylesterase
MKLLGVLFLGIAAPLAAKVTLAPLFTDNAVLQRDKPVPIWGQAAPGEQIIIQFHGLNTIARADSTGAWKAELPILPPSSVPSDLVVRGENTVTPLTLHDLVVGDVWLCSGRSAIRTQDVKHFIYRILNGAVEVAGAHYPLIRQYRVGHKAVSGSPASAGAHSGIWEACNPLTVAHFAPVGYFFARDIYRRTSIPIGIVSSLQDGSAEQLRLGRESGGMIQPIVPYALRGMLWDQGANNAPEDPKVFGDLIANWRFNFGQGDVPFYWIQRTGLGPNPDWPNTGQVSAWDLGRDDHIHPRNEQEVGRRLALLAARRVYGLPVECSGPHFAGAQPQGDAIRVSFDFAAGGLKATQPLATCEVAGVDHKFYPAQAVIDGNTLVVRSPQVPKPVAVRYAWTEQAGGHLYNAAGLPAEPFRSDSW